MLYFICANTMTKKIKCHALWVLCTLGAALPLIAMAQPTLSPELEHGIAEMATQLAQACPVADAQDQAAFDRCRQQLFKNTALQKKLSAFTLWGRQRDPNQLIKNTRLTQFSPEVLSGLYISLFMFDGRYKVTYDEREKMYLVKLNVGFRNRLQPGQFPYPFWHEADKWSMYEGAKSMLFWLDAKTGKARVVQFSTHGDGVSSTVAQVAPTPRFDGQWMWTDAQGKAQPAVTLFDGLFSNDNPYKEKLAQSYRTFALSLRDSQCLDCHVPNNPHGMSRLVLLQSPAHAAAEIKRLLKEVRNDRMPVDEFGLEQSLDPVIKALLLDRGSEFESVVDLARAWEKQASAATDTTGKGKP